MAQEYKHHHYVPIWYQRRFLPLGQKDQELYYLDLQPGSFIDGLGVRHGKRPVKRQGFRFCFEQEDLYTATFAGVPSAHVEKLFFGQIDNASPAILDFWARYTTFHDYDPKVGEPRDVLNALLLYMSTQKLRTPKGLGWLTEQARVTTGIDDRTQVLQAMVRFRALFSAIWVECVWQIADATACQTKFIVSDHPVTVYNRRCGPRSQWCRGYNDPDIRFHATHTLFPLSLEKILILTNLSWARNPYQSETGLRPNPAFFRDAIFNFEQIQTLRHLSDDEVLQINFIVKARALRHVGAAREEWLYPERFVSKSDWNSYGDGWLFMPDPRALHVGGTVLWGGGMLGGGPGAFDEYGRAPGHEDFERETKSFSEGRSLYRFQGEFAQRFGPQRRGQCTMIGQLVDRDSDELHKIHLSYAEKYR